MIVDLVIDDDLEDIEDSDDEDDSTVDSGTDNVGDPSVEINVEELINEIESQGLTKRLGEEQDARHRLEELMERKRASRELEDFDDYDI